MKGRGGCAVGECVRGGGLRLWKPGLLLRPYNVISLAPNADTETVPG